MAGAALGAVALLVVPLRPALLDVLLVLNLAASLVLLLLSLRVSRPLALAAFPTWIVLSTLLRLALNVSSTRLILLEGSAGRVISSFGSLVAGSSVVVGAVLFALLSIVQLIVIAKGAERVAEVGARFHLDALPGKQMAIDAELNQGGLDARGAAQRRKELALESQFYGAMDGAMKFVKGDVIAAFVIVFVNLSGGFALGMTERGMDAVTSLTHYGLLTIGDGLVTQIPSLISATSAAVLVTRVSGDERGAGRQLASQFSRHPETLALVAAACVLLGALPGMPFAPFLLIALGLFGATTFLRAARRSNAEDAHGRPSRLALFVAPDLAHLLPRRWSLRPSSIERVAENVSSASLAWLGFPESVTEERPTFAVAPELPPGVVELRARDRSVARASLEPSLAGAELRAACDALGLTLGRRLALHGAELLSLDDVETWLDETAEYAPAAVRAVVPHLFSLPELAEVLRTLLRERVPVRHLDVVLEALAKERKNGPPAADLAYLAEVARRALRSSLSRAVTNASGVVRVVQLDSLLEDTVREALHSSGGKTSCRLAPGAARDLASAVQRALAAAAPSDPPSATPVVLLTSSAVRRFVRELLAPTLPELSVVCAEELLPELRVDYAGTASPYDLAPVQMAV